MKKILLMALLLTMFLGMHAQTGMRMLITYFSWSGRTKNLAEEIQRQPDADIYRIEPLVSYTDDYQELACQISNKEKEENARLALKDTLSTLNDIANATPDSEHLDGLGTRGSLNVISQLESEATMATGFSVSRERSADNVKVWLQQINMISK